MPPAIAHTAPPRDTVPSKPAALLAAARTLLPVLEAGRALDASALREAMTVAFRTSNADGAWVWKDGRLRGGLDRDAETTASRQITSALAYAHAAGDIVAIIGRPGRGKTWAPERYCAGRMNAFYLAVSSAAFSLPGLLALVGEAISAGRHHRSALEAERTIIHRLRDRPALIVVNEAHHLRDKLLDELRIIRDRAGCGLALVADETIRMALARCQQVDGRIGLKIDLATQPTTDVEDIAAGVLGRQPSRAELRTLNAVG